MKAIKLFFGLVLVSFLFTSCYIDTDHYHNDEISLQEVITNYDIWYVDFNRTTGYGNVPFLSKAFTLTFQNGRMYANNNIVGIGFTGNGYGIQTGTFDTYNGILHVQHSQDGDFNFEVIVDNLNSIRLYNSYEDVTYYLEGYNSNTFDFDQVFYDNIEYFLQEYEVWAKTYTSVEGDLNDFDYENYLAFTPENITTFYSSVDDVNTPINQLIWDFEGDYEVFNINAYDDIKELKLYYNGGFIEEFEMTILDDATIELYHYDSGTTYEFEGIGYIQYKQQEVGSDENTERERFKVARKSVDRRAHKKEVVIKGSLENYKPNRGRK